MSSAEREHQAQAQPAAPLRACTSAEIGAIAHLYRAEIYRSTDFYTPMLRGEPLHTDAQWGSWLIRRSLIAVG